MRLYVAVALTLLGLCSLTEGALVTYTYTGPTVGIPESSAAGVNLDINVTDTFDLLSVQDVKITGTHSWVGDLIITLSHLPTNRTAYLIRRPGKTTAGNFGSSAAVFGDSSNLSGTYTFSNSTTTRLIDNADNGGNNYTVTPGTYAPTTNTFNGNSSSFSGETIVNLTNTFSPISNLSGTWRLNVADLAGADLGTISAFSFTVDAAVPEPGSMLLLAGGVVACGAVSRRSRKQASPRSPAAATLDR